MSWPRPKFQRSMRCLEFTFERPVVEARLTVKLASSAWEVATMYKVQQRTNSTPPQLREFSCFDSPKRRASPYTAYVRSCSSGI